jgi:hypothetical protein
MKYEESKILTPPCHFKTAILVGAADDLTAMMGALTRKKKICVHVTRSVKNQRY